MNEREKVAELLKFGPYVFDEHRGIRANCMAYRIDKLYSEREKHLREALEWACNVIKYDTECNLSKYGCKYCPIKQAREGK